MRKITLLFFCFVFIFFLSCKSKPAPIVQNFSAKFVAQCNGVEVKGNAVINKNNLISIKISSPDSMKGYVYYYKDDKLTIRMGNLKAETETAYLPKTALPSIVYNVFKSIPKENNCYLDSKNELYAIYKGSSDSGNFILKTQYSMGTISEITIKSIDFKIKFKAIKILS